MWLVGCINRRLCPRRRKTQYLIGKRLIGPHSWCAHNYGEICPCAHGKLTLVAKIFSFFTVRAELAQ
jgi:hypothetical protein